MTSQTLMAELSGDLDEFGGSMWAASKRAHIDLSVKISVFFLEFSRANLATSLFCAFCMQGF